MPTAPYIVNLDEQGITFTLRVWKTAKGWTWKGEVGAETVVNDGPEHKSADAAQAFGESACRERARAHLAPQALRARLELELAQAELAHDLAVATAAGSDGRGLGGALWKAADAQAIQRVTRIRSRIDELKAELAKLIE